MQHQPLKPQFKTISTALSQRIKPVSLRVKLLVGFSVVFSVVFAGAFYWFYTFTIDKTISRLKTDMRYTLEGAAKGVDVDELEALYHTGKPNAAGFSDDPRYYNQLAWFETVHRIEPRAWLYSYRVMPVSGQNQRARGTVPADQLEIVYLVDLWANYDAAKAARFLETERAGRAAYYVYNYQALFETPNIYRDRWGSWLSAAMPLRDDDGNVVAVLGLDIQADYVLQVQTAIRNRVLIAFIITYAILFVLIYGLSGILTQRLSRLTHSAQRISAGDYSTPMELNTNNRYPDEFNTLAEVFESMIHSIRTREQLIKEGKQTEYEIRLALQQERELNELKSRFVSMVSHELRTPLTVLRTSLELLERYGHLASEERKQQYFQRSRVAIETMTQLLEDVLTIGKAEAGKLDFQPDLIDLDRFCRGIVDEMQLGLGANHAIAFRYSADCGLLYFDPGLLRSILTNLLSNAVKYSPGGGIIDFCISCSEDQIIFEITDRGIGIPRDDQAMLFEMFHRARNVSTIRGTGLGLAIVKEAVAQHSGKVTFTSQEGVGTTFIVRLPLKSSPSPDPNSENAEKVKRP
ncbi:MAG TPA: HAMP domain-containing sensor histidine kinase [Chroococcidiopsis sp.]